MASREALIPGVMTRHHKILQDFNTRIGGTLVELPDLMVPGILQPAEPEIQRT